MVRNMSVDGLVDEARKLTMAEREELIRAVERLGAEPAKEAMERGDEIGRFIKTPLKLPGFQPLSREEANAR
mgnify:CR=1 FL=1